MHDRLLDRENRRVFVARIRDAQLPEGLINFLLSLQGHLPSLPEPAINFLPALFVLYDER
jgi:hypothetical protein